MSGITGTKVGLSLLITGILCVVEIYLYPLFCAFILCKFDKHILKEMLNYKIWIKLVILNFIIGTVIKIICTFAGITGIEITPTANIIISMVEKLYFLSLLAYYLKNIYEWANKNIIKILIFILIVTISFEILSHIF